MFLVVSIKYTSFRCIKFPSTPCFDSFVEFISARIPWGKEMSS